MTTTPKIEIIIGMETIDITPTWEALIPAMVQVLRNPKANSESVRGITEELTRLAKIVDTQNEEAKQNDRSRN